MTDKVQKIREEVERIREKIMGIRTDFADGQKSVLTELLAFIDTLQKEPVSSIWHDGCEIPKSETNILMIRKDEKDSNYPPIAGCFHGTNSRLDGRNWGYYNGFCYNEIEPPVKWVYIDDILNLSNVERTIKDWKEPVSEDLEKTIDTFLATYWGGEKEKQEWPFLKKMAIHFANWQKENLWKPADGDDLPEIDREVIALLDNGKVVFAHRPPEYWDGKNIVTGKVTRYYPKTYDKGGWNIPNVKYWLDCLMPNMEED